MKGLYEKVIKGKYPKISEKYSSDISDMLKLLFKLNPNERPSCDEILKNPIVIKRLEFFKSDIGNDKLDIANMDEAELLRTIRIPKNILFLSNKLPKANYETASTESDKIQENIKEIKNQYNISNNNTNPNNINAPSTNNKILPFIKKINKRYINNATENNNSEIRKRHLNVINERAHIIEEISDGDESSIKSPKKNKSISPNSLKRVPYSDIKLNNILKYQRQRRQIVPSISRPKNLNKGLSELYRLYVSNDYKKPIGKIKNNVPYLPNIYRRNNLIGKIGNNNSYINPNNLNSQKKLISLNVKI
jgi:NIMA (never in mitosis gene a)-related kinase